MIKSRKIFTSTIMETVPNVSNTMKEIEINTEATEYITNNYESLIKLAIKMGAAPEKAADALHNMFAILMSQELNGNGFDVNNGKDGRLITVQQFVCGRLKAYCKNEAYQKDTTSVKLDKNGNVKFKEVSACADSTEVENLNEFQVAYNLCPSYDDIEDIENAESVSEEIAYLLNFEGDFKMSMRRMLANISSIAESVDYIDMSLFSELREMGTEFKEAFKSVVTFAGKHPELYKTYLESALSC